VAEGPNFGNDAVGGHDLRIKRLRKCVWSLANPLNY
jgi:hypothetical protein